MRTLFLATPMLLHAAGACVQPLCVNRIDDNAAAPISGSLRYAVAHAEAGATITFDPALSASTIILDGGSANNHIKIVQDLTIQGPGAGLLTLSGGSATRIFFIASGKVKISGITLANGFAKGGNGGGGGAGMGGAIFLNAGSLTLDHVNLNGNRAVGGTGIVSGGGGGFGGDSGSTGNGASGGDLAGAGGLAGAFGNPAGTGGVGGPGSGGGQGGAGNGTMFTAFGGSGGAGGFGGGGGSGGAGANHNSVASGGFGGAGGFGGGGGAGGSSSGTSTGGDGPGGFGGGSGRGQGGFTQTPPAAGGGAGFGGAVFVSSGSLQLTEVTFSGNAATGGLASIATAKGKAKGGALFICSSAICGQGHDADVTALDVFFQSNLATDAGAAQDCPVRDDADVCGNYSPTLLPGTLSVASPAAFRASVGVQQTFLLDVEDTRGMSDLGIINILINRAIDGRQACYLAYDVAAKTLLLVDDAGDAGGPFARLPLNGSVPSVENNQCLVSSASAATISGQKLSIVLVMTFKSAFTGNRVVYAAARDTTGAVNTDWQAVGVYVIQ